MSQNENSPVNDFEYRPMDQVRVKALDVPAIVTGAMIKAAGLRSYRVAYRYDGQRRSEWVHANELLLKV